MGVVYDPPYERGYKLMNHTEPYNLGWFYGDEAKETIWFHKEKNGGSYMESVFWER